MGLLQDHNHFHSHDNSIRVNFPDTIKVHEHKAPTDESIKMLEEMHEKAFQNIIAKVRVDDNLIKGECWLSSPMSTGMYDYRITFKFKINGQEFTIDKTIDYHVFWDTENRRLLDNATDILKSQAYGIMMWYACKMLPSVVYEHITGTPPPKELIP